MSQFLRRDRIRLGLALFVLAIAPIVLAACNNGGGGPAY